MTAGIGLLALSLLVGDCVTVDRCLLARSVTRYSSAEISAADLLRQLSPTVTPCDPTCNAATAGESFYSAVEDLLPVLAQRLRAGDDGVWEVGFGLRQFADGGLLEDLDATLAGAIEAQPRLFLRAARSPAHQSAIQVVKMLGEAFVDTPKVVRCNAYRDRLAAVSSVADEDLQGVRAAVTRVLKSAIESCK